MKSITKANDVVAGQEKPVKSDEGEAVKFNPFARDYRVNPYPLYHRLRAEDPVHRSVMGQWILTRYADVNSVLRDRRFGPDPLPQRLKDKSQRLQHEQLDLSALVKATSQWLFFQNPPDHIRLRRLVSKAFSVNTVECMRPEVQEIVDGLIDQLRDAEVIDIMADLAHPLPVIVIARMLGVPDEDHGQLKTWAYDLIRVFDSLMSVDAYIHLDQVAREFIAYFRELIAEREKRPKADLISDLLAVREQNDRLTEDEMLGFCMSLFTAGEETTSDLTGNGMLTLLRYPNQMEMLKQQPTLIESAIEELLRYESPVQLLVRVSHEDAEIGGKTIHAGERVTAGLGAANRDPAQFSSQSYS